MIEVFRKNQRGLMLLVAILTIVSFIILYNTTQLEQLADNRTPSIYGRALDQAAIERQVKNYQLTLALGQLSLIQKLGGASEDRDMALTNFIWNLLVLQHESAKMGIHPTDSQVAARIKEMETFQTSGQFDPVKYSKFLAEQLTPRGFTERQLEEVVRDALRLEEVEKVVQAPAALGSGEVEATKRIFQPVTASYVKFDKSKAADGITTTPEEINSIYEQNKANLLTQETRGVEAVVFELPADSNPEGKEKVEALQALANAASSFVESISKEGLDFQKAAGKAGKPVQKIAPFDRTGLQETPDTGAIASALPELAPYAFQLAGPGGTTDVIQAGDAFYILHLTAVDPVRQLTLDESRGRIEAQIRANKAEQAFATSANSAFNAFKAAIDGGKSFAEAAAAQNLEVQKISNVIPAGKDTKPEDQMLAAGTLLLRDGELSGLERAPWGAFAIQLDSRGPIDTKELEGRETEIREGLLANKRDVLFAEWLRSRREQAGITVPAANQG